MSDFPEQAQPKSVSLFPVHVEIVEACERERRRPGFSSALQFIVEDWARMRGIQSQPAQQEVA
jgi:hypothetical protein